ncbi:uncharacterized protein [Onthophagus taurus]|uniref:uncharacterized protein n=1 Tax=Onthophagus taurus TaxID=166361 RepID=UPI0039BE03B7
MQILAKFFRRNSIVLTRPFRRKFSSAQEYLKSTFPDVQIPKLNIVEYVFQNFERWPNNVAVECGLSGKKYTYDEVRLNSIYFGNALRKLLKLEKGDVVAIHLPNIPEYPICALGILSSGLRITTINPAYTSAEIRRQILDSNAKLIITLNDGYRNCKDATLSLKTTIPIVIVKDKNEDSIPNKCINFQELIDYKFKTEENIALDYDDVVHLPYSSGTTGMPKGVMLTNKNIVANIEQFHAPQIRFINECSGSDQDVVPCVLPMFHIFGFSLCMLALLQKGCKMVTLPKFTPNNFLNVLSNHKPHAMELVPPIVVFLNTHEGVKKDYFENLRTILCGAAPLGALDEEKFRKTVGKSLNVLQGYGLTETSPSVISMPVSQQGKYPGSIGHPLPNTALKIIKIDDQEGTHLGPNKVGELLIKGPQVMQGYFNKDEETKNAFLNGWFRSGDLARYNEDGMLYIEDRIKELIKVKGFQVPPAELEEIIRDFPGVAEAAVIGVPNKYTGELPRAYVVTKPGHNVNIATLEEFVNSKVTSYKKLAGGIALVNSIPKTASGKILRRELKLLFEKDGI